MMKKSDVLFAIKNFVHNLSHDVINEILTGDVVHITPDLHIIKCIDVRLVNNVMIRIWDYGSYQFYKNGLYHRDPNKGPAVYLKRKCEFEWWFDGYLQKSYNEINNETYER